MYEAAIVDFRTDIVFVRFSGLLLIHVGDITRRSFSTLLRFTFRYIKRVEGSFLSKIIPWKLY